MLSLGAGVRSTILALTAAHGDIGPMPDCAIFADTGWEPSAVREHLAWLISGNVLPFPVRIVSNGNRADLLRAGSGERWGLGLDPRFHPHGERNRVEAGMIPAPMHQGLQVDAGREERFRVFPRDEPRKREAGCPASPILVRSFGGLTDPNPGRR